MDNASYHYLDGFLTAVGREHRGAEAAVPATPARQPPEETVGSGRFPAQGMARTREEQIKDALHPLDAFPRLRQCAQENCPPDAEDRFRFQWFGLFYQGPQQDAFLARIRLPGGRLKPFQLAGLAEISQELAGGYLLLNGAGGIDLPGVPVRAATEILRRIEGIGLSTRQTGGDCVRAVRGGEYTGQDGDESSASVFRLVCELEQALAYARGLSNLPQSCEIVLQAVNDEPDQGCERSDQSIVLQALPAQPGTTGGFSESPPSCRYLFVPPGGGDGSVLAADEVVPACLGLLAAWATNGDRTNRQRGKLSEFYKGSGREPVGAFPARTEARAEGSSPTKGPVASGRRSPSGLAVPGRRLLSGQLARLAAAARERQLADVCLTRGCFRFARGVADTETARVFGEVFAAT